MGVLCDVFGGVGGLGDGTTSASGSMSNSGTLPAASLSKMLSLGSSSDLAGGRGRGLLMLAGLTEDARPGGVGGVPIRPPEIRRSSAAGLSFSLNSTLINLPCLVAGGGGGFLRAAGFGWAVVDTGPRLYSSPSGSEISCDVRGVSCIYVASNKDCRDTDEASVILPPSPVVAVWCEELEVLLVAAAPGVGPWPVNNNLLKASTSRPAFPGDRFCSADDCPPSFAACSMSSNVLPKGLAGGPRPVYGWSCG